MNAYQATSLSNVLYRQGQSANYVRLAFNARVTPSGAVAPTYTLDINIEAFALPTSRLLLLHNLLTRKRSGYQTAIAYPPGMAVTMSAPFTRYIGTLAHVPQRWDMMLDTSLSQKWPKTGQPFEEYVGTFDRRSKQALWTWEPNPDWIAAIAANFPTIPRSARP